jgi:hypothetical protein
MLRVLSFTEDEYPDSDFLIITKNKEILHVHRSVLRAASGFFNGPTRFHR